MHLRQVGDLAKRVIDAVAQVIVGKDGVLRQVLMGILSDGHILIQDNPGLAKTLIAHSFSEVLDIAYSRIQFTPDLLPGEITGGYIYNQREAQFEFRRGPLFANLLLGDEINRATPKTQSALLEAMQERQVTVEGERFPLDPPFIVIATQNPVEFEGTYPLPEAQLDASSCASASATRTPSRSWRSCCAASSASRTPYPCSRWCPIRTCWRCSAPSRRCT